MNLEAQANFFDENRSEQKPLAADTDITGNFKVLGAYGAIITVVSVEKKGFQLSKKTNRTFSYTLPANFHPDPNSPVIFQMWRNGAEESLVSNKKVYGIIPDNRPYTIDLLRHKKIEGLGGVGDIIVRISRPPTIPQRSKFNWSYSIEAIDGGITHTYDEFLYRAPESGYRPRYEVSMSATNAYWQPEVRDEQFYIKSRNGKLFGCLTVEVIPDYNDKSVFKVEYYVNPSGSRNLER